MEDRNIAIRLKVFIDSQGLTYSQFADRCGIPRPSLSQIISGRNKKISDIIVGQIHKTFPELSVLWLMFGEGPMLMQTPSGNNVSQLSDDFDFGSGTLFSDNENLSDRTTQKENRGNLSGLTSPSEGSQKTHYKRVDDDLRIVELQKQIEKLQKNPRKVSQITIYYDDSTFETFYPQR